MLFLTFRVGKDEYGIEGSKIVEILPLVQWKRIPQAPAGLAGMFSYHGVPIHLIDLTELMLGTPSRQRMSTRIVVVNYQTPSGGKMLGLLAEQVTETVHLRESDLQRSHMTITHAPYLGAVVNRPAGILQCIDLARLLPEEVWSELSSQAAGLA